jgi:hypothetical protein
VEGSRFTTAGYQLLASLEADGDGAEETPVEAFESARLEGNAVTGCQPSRSLGVHDTQGAGAGGDGVSHRRGGEGEHGHQGCEHHLVYPFNGSLKELAERPKRKRKSRDFEEKR